MVGIPLVKSDNLVKALRPRKKTTLFRSVRDKKSLKALKNMKATLKVGREHKRERRKRQPQAERYVAPQQPEPKFSRK